MLSKLESIAETEKLIDDCDALDIVAPTSFHFELCEAAIKKGKHVFVEKPLANTPINTQQFLRWICVSILVKTI